MGETFQRLSLARRNEDKQHAAKMENRPLCEFSAVKQASYQRMSSQVLRCTVGRLLTGERFRDFERRLSESMLLRSFCKLDWIETVRILGKSALQRYGQWLPEKEMRKVTGTLLGAAASAWKTLLHRRWR